MAIGDLGRSEDDTSATNGGNGGSEGSSASSPFGAQPGPGFSAPFGAPAAPLRVSGLEGSFQASGSFGKAPETPGDDLGLSVPEIDPFGDEIDPFAPPESLTGAPVSDGTRGAGAFDPASELDLGDGEMRLPWLEGDDEEDEDERGGIGQTTILLLMALVAIAVLAGGIFWVLHNRGSETLVADGGVIEAPAEPYKTRPVNPGGEVVDGTGDTSFAVAEGQSRTPQIADEPPAAPGFTALSPKGTDAKDPAKADAGKPAAAPSAAPAAKVAAPVEPAGVGVQVGAYTSQASAEKGWLTLKGQYAPLAEVKHRVVQGQADIGTVYRLQAVPGDLAAAKALCSGMRAAGLSCQVKR